MTALRRMLIDSVSLYKKTDDPDTRVKGKDPSTVIEVPRCRVDRSHQYTFSGTAQVLLFDMTIFIYPKYANNVVVGSDYENGIATVDGMDFDIVSIVQNMDPHRKHVFSYEIGIKKAGN